MGERHHDEADDGAGQAEDKHGTPAIPIGEIAERRRGDQLTQREGAKQQADDERRRAELLGVERQQGNDDPEPDEIDEDRQEDDEKRPAQRVPFPALGPLLSRTGA